MTALRAVSTLDDETERLELDVLFAVMLALIVFKAASMLEDDMARNMLLPLLPLPPPPRAVSMLEDDKERFPLDVRSPVIVVLIVASAASTLDDELERLTLEV